MGMLVKPFEGMHLPRRHLNQMSEALLHVEKRQLEQLASDISVSHPTAKPDSSILTEESHHGSLNL